MSSNFEVVRWLHALRQRTVKLADDNSVRLTVIADAQTDMAFVTLVVEYQDISVEFDLTDANFSEADELLEHCVSRLENAIHERDKERLAAPPPRNPYLTQDGYIVGRDPGTVH